MPGSDVRNHQCGAFTFEHLDREIWIVRGDDIVTGSSEDLSDD